MKFHSAKEVLTFVKTHLDSQNNIDLVIDTGVVIASIFRAYPVLKEKFQEHKLHPFANDNYLLNNLTKTEVLEVKLNGEKILVDSMLDITLKGLFELEAAKSIDLVDVLRELVKKRLTQDIAYLQKSLEMVADQKVINTLKLELENIDLWGEARLLDRGINTQYFPNH